MRISYMALVAALLFTTSCEQNGGIGSINGKDLLSRLEGPKIPTMRESQLEAAKKAEEAEDFAQSSLMYQQILSRDPNDIEVVGLLADSMRRGGEYDKAIAAYDNVLVKEPKNLTAKEGKALALLAKGDFETPTELLEEVIKSDRTRWKSLNGMGILFVTRGLYSDSLIYFNEALKYSPSNAAVMNNLGLAEALNKNYAAALETLQKAAMQTSVGSNARKRIDLNLALVYASSGNLENANKIAASYLSGAALSNNMGLYAHLARDDKTAKAYLNMALTESKTYYEKAWENLDAINSQVPLPQRERVTGDSDNNTSGIPKEKEGVFKEKPSDKNQKNTKKLENRKEVKNKVSGNEKVEGKITITPEPPATKSEVKSIGQIISKELHKSNDSINEESENQLIVMPNEIQNNGEDDVITNPQTQETQLLGKISAN